MEDVLETDEKPVTLHADVRPASAALSGREARRDHEYERCGTANVFCACGTQSSHARSLGV
jgi:hypothetical protein